MSSIGRSNNGGAGHNAFASSCRKFGLATLVLGAAVTTSVAGGLATARYISLKALEHNDIRLRSSSRRNPSAPIPSLSHPMSSSSDGGSSSEEIDAPAVAPASAPSLAAAASESCSTSDIMEYDDDDEEENERIKNEMVAKLAREREQLRGVREENDRLRKLLRELRGEGVRPVQHPKEAT